MHCHSPARVQAVQLAMDRKDRERELVSVALPELVPRVISGETPFTIRARCSGAAESAGADSTWTG